LRCAALALRTQINGINLGQYAPIQEYEECVPE